MDGDWVSCWDEYWVSCWDEWISNWNGASVHIFLYICSACESIFALEFGILFYFSKGYALMKGKYFFVSQIQLLKQL